MENLTALNASNDRKTPSTRRTMIDLLIALAPATIASVVLFGFKALLIIATCVTTALAAEFVFNLLCKREQTVGDLTAVVTGLLLALNLSTKVNLWQCLVGTVFAVIIIKCAFGGRGRNFANPAITARIVLLLSFAGSMSDFSTKNDAISSATPLSGGTMPSMIDLS